MGVVSAEEPRIAHRLDDVGADVHCSGELVIAGREPKGNDSVRGGPGPGAEGALHLGRRRVGEEPNGDAGFEKALKTRFTDARGAAAGVDLELLGCRRP